MKIKYKERKGCIMKTLRGKMKALSTKKVPMRAMLVMALVMAMTTVMSVTQEMGVMAGGWDDFKKNMTDWFYKGLGQSGLQGLGIAIAVIGITMTVISIVVHKINPQSRMPGWFTCLVITVIGTLLFTGVEPVLKIITKIRDVVMGWMGFSGFGDFS